MRENDWDHNVEGDEIEDPVGCVSGDEVVQALNGKKKQEKPLNLQMYQ